MRGKSQRRARMHISAHKCGARGSPRSRRSAEMEPQSGAATLWHGLKQNLLAGGRLALFLPVRALDFRISIGQYVALVFTSLVFWFAGGMLREGFPGTLDFGALTVALAEIPLILGTCLVAARLFREAQLALAFAVLLVASDPVSEIVGLAIQFATDFDAIEPYAVAANWSLVAWVFAVLVRTQLVLTGWRGRASVLALGLFAGLLAPLVWVLPRAALWGAAWAPQADAAEPRVVREEP